MGIILLYYYVYNSLNNNFNFVYAIVPRLIYVTFHQNWLNFGGEMGIIDVRGHILLGSLPRVGGCLVDLSIGYCV
jgi:hypothetical protein